MFTVLYGSHEVHAVLLKKVHNKRISSVGAGINRVMMFAITVQHHRSPDDGARYSVQKRGAARQAWCARTCADFHAALSSI